MKKILPHVVLRGQNDKKSELKRKSSYVELRPFGELPDEIGVRGLNPHRHFVALLPDGEELFPTSLRRTTSP